MKKISKFLIIFLIIIQIPIINLALEDEYEELDFVWLEEEITKAKEANTPNINSRYAVIYDRASKTVIWGKDEKREVPMASTTKIMTAIVMLENITNLQEKVEVCKQAANVGGSRLGLKTGDVITYNDLLYGLMLCSGNDAATQIAISIGGSVSGFAEMMNKKAEEMGLTHSHFVTPHGLDNEGHYTTALELAIMADYALDIEKFAQVVNTQSYTVNINGYSKNINNTNELLGYLEGVNGIKTGFTNGAGRCLVTSVSRNNFDIITVVLGADTKKIRTSDSIKLIEYTYKNYELVNIEEKIKEEFEEWKSLNKRRIIIEKANTDEIVFNLGKLTYKEYPIKKGEENLIYADTKIKYTWEAPILQNTKIGTIYVYVDNTKIDEIEIKVKEEIPRKNIKNYMNELLCLYSHL